MLILTAATESNEFQSQSVGNLTDFMVLLGVSISEQFRSDIRAVSVQLWCELMVDIHLQFEIANIIQKRNNYILIQRINLTERRGGGEGGILNSRIFY